MRAGSGARAPCWVPQDYEDGDVLRVLPACGHRYHVECIDKWCLAATDFSRPPACPLCNAEV